MLCMGVVLLLGSVSARVNDRITHEELVTFVRNFIEKLQITSDLKKYESCVEDKIIQSWEDAIVELGKMKPTDPVTTLQAFAAFLQPAMGTLGMVQPCGKSEIETVYQKIHALIQDKQAFIKKVVDNIDVIAQLLSNLFDNWKRAQYQTAGEDTGALLFNLFLN